MKLTPTTKRILVDKDPAVYPRHKVPSIKWFEKVMFFVSAKSPWVHVQQFVSRANREYYYENPLTPNQLYRLAEMQVGD
jgi:hypothetical protein